MTDESSRWTRRAIYAGIRAGTVAIGTAPRESDLPDIAAAGEHLADHMAVEGSGFVADPRGIVITAKHVLKDWIEDRASARDAGTPPALPNPVVISQVAPPSAFAEGGDPGAADPDVWIVTSADFMVHDSLDLAAILMVGMQSLPPGLAWFAIPPADEECHVGDEVVAAGFPLGMRLHKGTAPGIVCTPSMVSGVVSAILPTAAGRFPRNGVQFDATIVRGASGGPVCDALTGHVVGMTIETWDGIDPRFVGERGRPVDRFVAFPRAIPLFELRAFVERARRRWESWLNPITRHWHRSGMPVMALFAPDPQLPWLPPELKAQLTDSAAPTDGPTA